MNEPNTGYPKWIYHDTEAARIVKSFEEHEEAGEEWRETPSPAAADSESEGGEDKTKRMRKKKTEE